MINVTCTRHPFLALTASTSFQKSLAFTHFDDFSLWHHDTNDLWSWTLWYCLLYLLTISSFTNTGALWLLSSKAFSNHISCLLDGDGYPLHSALLLKASIFFIPRTLSVMVLFVLTGPGFSFHQRNSAPLSYLVKASSFSQLIFMKDLQLLSIYRVHTSRLTLLFSCICYIRLATNILNFLLLFLM